MLLLALVLAQVLPGTKLLDPISYRQVTVFPIARTGKTAPKSDALTLREGISKKLVTVSERGDVNSVSVENHTAHPLLLVGGEMILGGQQDRIIGHDQVVPPHRSAVVQVFCVEHGRWSGGRRFGAAGGIVDAGVRGKAKLHANQHEVWDEVAKKTAQMKAQTPTGTYRAIGESADEAIRPYREAIKARMEKLPDVVGVASAVNGRIVAVDVFGAPELFAQYRDRILDAVFVGAIGAAEDHDAPPATPAAVEKFVDKARAAKSESVVRSANGEMLMDSALPAE